MSKYRSLLTSEDVIQNKKRRLQMHEEKEKKRGKGKRKGKEQSNRQERAAEQEEEEEEEDNIPCGKCKKVGGGNWIMCDSCNVWMHQRCVCALVKPAMQMRITKNLSFICEFCSEMNVEP